MPSKTIDQPLRGVASSGPSGAERDGRTRCVETVIIGGGQAGLATAYGLTRRGRECVVLDAGSRVGDSWRARWPSLRLYSAARLDGLPGMRFPAPGHSFPSAAEMADFLEAYAARFELPVVCGVAVQRLERRGGADGFPEQERGAVRDCPGLYFAGLVFQDSFSSMLILGARRDGERVARQIAGRRAARA